MNTPRAGSVAKAWTEVSTPERTRKVPEQREREGQDRQQDGPALQRVALLDHDRRVQQRGAGQPGHERGVLDRVPEPPAAPAELVVGPPAAERDAERQRDPGRQRPGPHPARPGGVDPALDQRRDRERVGGREADIAEIEHRRMEGEAGVLQDRVQALAVERRRVEAQERVRGEQHEGEEARPRSAPARASTRARNVGGRLRPNSGDGAAEQRQDPDPEDAASPRDCPRCR